MGEERAAIQLHLADCDECREVVADLVRLEDPPQPRVLPFWKRPKSRVVGGGILVLAASLALVVQMRPELNPFRGPTAYEELLAAAGTNRTVEARLTGFQYAPLRSPTRSEGGSALSDNHQLVAAAARILETAGDDPALRNNHDVGVAHLLLGEFDNAVRTLEEASLASPAQATYLSDLAAAYLARSDALMRADDLPKALAAADKALEINPRSPEAWFSRGLALGRLSRAEDATIAWQEYLKLDQDSGWAEEARRHLKATARNPSRPVG